MLRDRDVSYIPQLLLPTPYGLLPNLGEGEPILKSLSQSGLPYIHKLSDLGWAGIDPPYLSLKREVPFLRGIERDLAGF